jgi:hypothetical protein
MEYSPANSIYSIMLDWSAKRHTSWDFLVASSEEEILVFPRLAIATKVGNQYLKEWEENHIVSMN